MVVTAVRENREISGKKTIVQAIREMSRNFKVGEEKI